MSSTKIVCFLVLSLILTMAGGSPCLNRPILFNFGDGNSDTGGGAVLRGMPIDFPDGRAFFPNPTGRMCDGRLVLDFLCESLWTKYLDHYFQLLSPDFSNGVNFATNGSKISEVNSVVPFKLKAQVASFRRFYNLSIASGLMCEEQFREKALYLFEIGQNDIDRGFKKLPFDRLLSYIPTLVSELKAAIHTIYGLGGRNFWIHNTGPVGCLPKNVANRNASDTLDANGCIAKENEATVALNKAVEMLCSDLRSEMADATIVYVDMYAIKLDLIVHSAYYGFEDPFTACYDREAETVCTAEEGARYVSWDGTYFTEAANSFAASRILSANFSTPPLDFNFFCT